MSDPTPVQGWSELLLALPEFVMVVAIDESYEQAASATTIAISEQSGFTRRRR